MVKLNSGLRRWALGVNAVEYLMKRADASQDIFPVDDPHGVIAGPSADRILVVGEGTAVGLGVLTYDLAVAAQLARQYAQATGRGVEWSAVEVPGFRLKNTVEALDSAQSVVRKVDVVVVMLGITDTFMLTSRRRWREEMQTTLDTLLERIPADATVLVADVSPLENVASVSRAGRMAAGRHAQALNAINRDLLKSRPRCVRAQFPPELRYELWKPAGEQMKWAQLYVGWASSMMASLTLKSLPEETPNDAAR